MADRVTQLIRDLYTNSEAAKGYLDDLAGSGPIRIGFGDNAAYLAAVDGAGNPSSIRFNPDDLVDAINEVGQHITLPPAAVLGHELAHWKTGDHDLVSSDNPAALNGIRNARNYDYYGKNIVHKFVILDELSASGYIDSDQDWHRASYVAATNHTSDLWSQIDVGIDYAMGGTIEVFRFGNVNYADLNDVIDLSQQHNVFSIAALSGDDQVKGSDGNDLIWGGTGEDHLNGNGGYDQIWGGDDADKIMFGTGFGVAYGEKGDDTIFAGDFGGTLDGGEGKDTLVGSSNDCPMTGGAGDDTIFVKASATVDCGGDNDTVVIDSAGAASSYIDLMLGTGSDSIYLSNDGVYSAFDQGSLALTIDDPGTDDVLVWDGHLLTGGALTVLHENTDGEVHDGGVAWLDAIGTAFFWYQDTSQLHIVLPDAQTIDVTGFDNGDLGITLTGDFRPWSEDDPWPELPRANTASMDFPLYFETGAFAVGDTILEALDVRQTGFASPGYSPAPDVPIASDYGFL